MSLNSQQTIKATAIHLSQHQPATQTSRHNTLECWYSFKKVSILLSSPALTTYFLPCIFSLCISRHRVLCSIVFSFSNLPQSLLFHLLYNFSLDWSLMYLHFLYLSNSLLSNSILTTLTTHFIYFLLSFSCELLPLLKWLRLLWVRQPFPLIGFPAEHNCHSPGQTGHPKVPVMTSWQMWRHMFVFHFFCFSVLLCSL